MKIQIKEGSIGFHLLGYIWAAEDLAMTLFTPHTQWRKLSWCKDYNTYRTTTYRLIKSGFIELIKKENQKFLKLTPLGELQVLLAKARLPQKQKWDGKWRLIIFDIPEQFKHERSFFRNLLKKNGFVKIQASVYISPYVLNREAVAYLKQTGLIKFIRIIRADELDEDTELIKKFGLK